MIDVDELANEVLDWEVKRLLKGLYGISKKTNENTEINYRIDDAKFSIKCELDKVI